MAGRRGDLIEPGAPGDWISEGPVLDQMSAELVAMTSNQLSTTVVQSEVFAQQCWNERTKSNLFPGFIPTRSTNVVRLLKEPSASADGHSQILRSSALVKGTNSPTCFVHPNARVHRST